VLVRQGDVSDCMYVLKSGQVGAPGAPACVAMHADAMRDLLRSAARGAQVCVLINPTLTLTEANAGSTAGPSAAAASAAAETGGEIDTKKLVQVRMRW
jgi:hypothetical protein